MKRQHNDTIPTNNSEFTKTKLRKTTNMTSYPSPTYSFEESSDYYRFPIGRPTTPVDKIVNSLEHMPISPIKNNNNNKTEVGFTPSTLTTSEDFFIVEAKTRPTPSPSPSPSPSPTPSPAGTPPPARSPSPSPSPRPRPYPHPHPRPRPRPYRRSTIHQRLLSHNLRSISNFPEIEIYLGNEPKSKSKVLETSTTTTTNNLQITDYFNPFGCLNFNPFAPFTNSPYPFSYSQPTILPTTTTTTKATTNLIHPILLPPPIFMSEENNTNKNSDENFPFIFITGGSRTDNVVCTNPKCPCDAKPSYFVEKFFNY
ncbi:conserved hypothetical protein [Candida dubliniensis CD36]|uniref:Uncharacterized protein n=1 Tax=Candida dubliniensis (strain CD36 / ATCC MYA-646 / CBS 7987 / NCPF 3949 / NRRL Y-17841) TaxID=573826 RepID=B9WLU1_CANDC|nr:conserved hypothetical protein [Candida dubliniensis CD36]CAX40053.1 conserved hypothetical protein [Candida dubliniensis CD36]